VVADIGTGDGSSVLSRAGSEPASLVLGMDAAADAMAEASRRAFRHGPANALFLVAGAETLADTVLAGRIDLVTVTFPWGSLLRGVLGLDPVAMAGVAALIAPGGQLDLLASVVPSDWVDGIATLDAGWEPAMCRSWAGVGLEIVSIRPATTAEIAATRSSWARRLAAERDARPTWRIELCRR